MLTTTSAKIRLSRRQEADGAARTGARLTPRSGAGIQKNDAVSEHLLQEYKRTDNKRQITIKLDDLRSLELEATLQGKNPVMGIQMGAADYWVLTDSTFCELLQAAGWV
jgi:hypothetical protein